MGLANIPKPSPAVHTGRCSQTFVSRCWCRVPPQPCGRLEPWHVWEVFPEQFLLPCVTQSTKLCAEPSSAPAARAGSRAHRLQAHTAQPGLCRAARGCNSSPPCPDCTQAARAHGHLYLATHRARAWPGKDPVLAHLSHAHTPISSHSPGLSNSLQTWDSKCLSDVCMSTLRQNQHAASLKISNIKHGPSKPSTSFITEKVKCICTQ